MVQVRDQMAQLAAENGLKVSPALASQLLPTVTASENGGLGAHGEGGDNLRTTVAALLPTPNTMDMLPRRSDEALARSKKKGGTSNLKDADIVRNPILMPTPIVSDAKGTGPADANRHTTQLRAINVLLPTPTTIDSRQNDTPSAKSRNSPSVGALVHMPNWGKFAPAIARWEQTLGRPAPAPTKPDGKDGAHRLSSAFTEWMMGLPEGWITDCGLTRNEELKACGNGVVPQQAALALRILLDGMTVERERERAVMFPTPTVSDTFTDNLSSTQQKDGSMHSVTLPQAVRMIDD
jgi:DNA (cytosine-5)-methyltransferase 1